MSLTNPTCVVCKLDLSTRKGFKEKDGWEKIKFCSSKCRKSTSSKSRKKRSVR